MQIFGLLAVSASLLAGVNTFPLLGNIGLALRDPANANAKGGKAKSSAAATSSVVADNAKAKTSSADVAKVTTTATSTVDVDPDFDRAAGTSAEKVAAVSLLNDATLSIIC